MEFDYVIVGGGSAGCVVASLLSTNPDVSVALIEAGGTNRTVFSQIPFLTMFTLPYRLKNWHFKTIKQANLNNRRGYQPRGKLLGGSSGINAMIYIRGQAEDYDEWAEQSGENWNFQSVLPIFKQLEANQNISDDFHGNEGYLNVEYLKQPNPASHAFIQAGIAKGYKHTNDFNGSEQQGVGLYQVTQKDGRRHSAADAFIEPVLTRPNLTVLTKTHALQLILEGSACQGVRVKHKGSVIDVKAKQEVILSAGVYGSAQLLMLSGIGPEDELNRHKIAIKHKLPGVGFNLHDHPDYILSYASKNTNLMGFTPYGAWKMIKAFFEYRKTKQGLFSTNFAEAGAFFCSDSTVERPDIQLHFVPGIIDKHLQKVHFKFGSSCHVSILRPKSRGRLRLNSASPYAAPQIDFQLLTHPDDMQGMLKGIHIAREWMAQSAMAPYAEKEMFVKTGSDEELIELIKQRADTIYHPVGTCRMGRDDMAVVDEQLRVYGIENLRVADASIMPQVVSGNTNAPSMMIGAQAARFIQQQN